MKKAIQKLFRKPEPKRPELPLPIVPRTLVEILSDFHATISELNALAQQNYEASEAMAEEIIRLQDAREKLTIERNHAASVAEKLHKLVS